MKRRPFTADDDRAILAAVRAGLASSLVGRMLHRGPRQVRERAQALGVSFSSGRGFARRPEIPAELAALAEATPDYVPTAERPEPSASAEQKAFERRCAKENADFARAMIAAGHVPHRIDAHGERVFDVVIAGVWAPEGAGARAQGGSRP